VQITNLILRLLPLHPLKWHKSEKAVALRELLAAHSGYNRASCQSKLHIQRVLGGFPPVISAENLHNLQFLHQIERLKFTFKLELSQPEFQTA
jgi:hypothetical protein